MALWKLVIGVSQVREIKKARMEKENMSRHLKGKQAFIGHRRKERS